MLCGLRYLHLQSNTNKSGAGDDDPMLDKLMAPLHTSQNKFSIKGEFTFDNLNLQPVKEDSDQKNKRSARGASHKTKQQKKAAGPKIDEAELFENMNSLVSIK